MNDYPAVTSYVPSGYGRDSNTDAPVYPNGFFEEHDVDEGEVGIKVVIMCFSLFKCRIVATAHTTGATQCGS